MSQLLFRIQKLSQKVHGLRSQRSSRHLFAFAGEKMFFNKKFILAATGVSLLTIPAAYALQSQLDGADNSNTVFNQEVTANSEAVSPASTDAGSNAQASVSNDDAHTSVSANTNGVSGSITINGQTTPLPANGNISKTVPSNDGSSSVQVNVNSNSQNSGGSYQFHSNSSSVSSSSSNVNINTHTSP